MKIVAVLGSPHKNGNGAAALKKGGMRSPFTRTPA